jgi:hypothetical protein
MSGAEERVTGGLTLNGTVSLKGPSFLGFGVAANETESVTGNGSIVFGDNSNNRLSLDAGVALTIGAGVTVRGNTGLIGQAVFTSPTGTLTVQGVLQADVAGGTLTLVSATTTNSNQLKALNGGTLVLDGPVNGTGTITTDTGHNSAVVQNGAVVTGNTISGEFQPNGSGGNELSGVIVSSTGTVDMQNAIERVTGGLTLNGTISVKVGSFLGFGIPANETESVTGNGSIVFGDNSAGNHLSLDSGVALTIGAGVTVRGNTGNIGPAVFSSPTGTLINDGEISGDLGNGTLTVNPAIFTNNGTINVAPGSTVNVTTGNPNFTNFNSGTSTLTGGTYIVAGTAALAGTFEFPGANIATTAATIILNGPLSQILNDQTSANALDGVLATNAAAGSLTLLNGRTLTTPGALSNAGAVTIDATGGASQLTATGSYTQTGGSTTLVAGGTLASTTSTVNISAGTLQGTGKVTGNVTVGNTATLSPGTATNAGKIAITGNLTMNSGSTLTAKLTGPNTTTPVGGTDYDQVTATGTITLNSPILNGSIPNASSPLKKSVLAGIQYQCEVPTAPS